MSTNRRLPFDINTAKVKLSGNLELAITMMGEALEALSQDKEAKPLIKFEMGQKYIAMFMSVDAHIMKAENHKAEARLKRLTAEQKQLELNEKNGDASENKSYEAPIAQSKFKPTMN